MCPRLSFLPWLRSLAIMNDAQKVHELPSAVTGDSLPMTTLDPVSTREDVAPPVADSASSNDLPKEPTENVPHGLTDQTNFLPTKQVITVFMGLSVALACSFLDQTMYVLTLLLLSFSVI